MELGGDLADAASNASGQVDCIPEHPRSLAGVSVNRFFHAEGDGCSVAYICPSDRGVGDYAQLTHSAN